MLGLKNLGATETKVKCRMAFQKWNEIDKAKIERFQNGIKALSKTLRRQINLNRTVFL